LVRYVITVIKFATNVGDKVFSDNDILIVQLCEWPQTQKFVINTSNHSYSNAGKYYLPVGTDLRPKYIGKYRTQIYSGSCSQSSIVRKTGTYNICRT